LHRDRPADSRHDGDYDHGGRNIRANPLHGLHPRNSACIRGPMPTLQAFAALAGSASIVVDDRQFRPTLSIPRRIVRPADTRTSLYRPGVAIRALQLWMKPATLLRYVKTPSLGYSIIFGQSGAPDCNTAFSARITT
jgi:hypothetical protein